MIIISADNGIYILKLKDQFRVLHTTVIENLYWTYEDSNFGTPVDTPVPTRIIEYYGDCKYTRSKEIALNIAYSMLLKLSVCEYGIQAIQVNKTWKQIVIEANVLAGKELDYLALSESDCNRYAYERLIKALNTVNQHSINR